MKILIGITQDLDSAKEDVSIRYRGLGTSTEVGPFPSRNEAEKWKNFMMTRRDNYQEINQKDSTNTEGNWFGFTIESPILH